MIFFSADTMNDAMYTRINIKKFVNSRKILSLSPLHPDSERRHEY